MIEMQSQKEDLKETAASYRDTKVNLNEMLYETFEDDLAKWDANITNDNAIIFNAPNVLFALGKSEIKPEFQTILTDFFPRYIKILTSPVYIDAIEEVRIEGHTTNTWGKSSNPREIYLSNMQLSQERALAVLAFCYTLDDSISKTNRSWIEQFFRANGMAFAKTEGLEQTRRVEFRVVLKSEEKVFEILK